MLVADLFIWWYTRGWSQVVHDFRRRTSSSSKYFSIPVLLDTLFSPWKRILTYPGDNIGTRFKASVDNTVSRLVGFVIRFLTLLLAGIILLVVSILSLILMVVWPLIPIAIVLCIVGAIIG